MKERALALAGLLQSAEAVTRLATGEPVRNDIVENCVSSIFRLDAPSTEAIFGKAENLRRGMELLAAQAAGNVSTQAVHLRIALTVLQVERRLIARPDLLQRLQQGIIDAEPAGNQFGLTSEELHARLGELYAQTISTLTPRVLVQGDPGLLSQSRVVMSIRTLLLAAVRSAVLWRQLGGSYWDFFLRRGKIAHAARTWLREIDH
ncbi:lysogenization protein HflD [Pseudomarimonas arenosa]|uniref:DUF489 family protein n=1 Tax=Pseudomarimonas arenosa TaxID=2774145 RepID=A0AAW3ZNM8_9GAMM|nr:DUF489 family protein [Pseudomarimonas arenosa]MBD8526682.1 DUF489 family protein [Pseudomarimonas arenosa]